MWFCWLSHFTHTEFVELSQTFLALTPWLLALFCDKQGGYVRLIPLLKHFLGVGSMALAHFSLPKPKQLTLVCSAWLSFEHHLLNFVFSTNSHWWNRTIVVLRVISEKQCFLFPEKETVCFQETRFAMWKTFGGGAGGGGKTMESLKNWFKTEIEMEPLLPKHVFVSWKLTNCLRAFRFGRPSEVAGRSGGKTNKT